MLDDSGEHVAGLAERILAGDRAAEAELVHCFSQRVFALLCARTREPEASRDLLQDVLISALMALRRGQLREADKLAAFVLSIARNTAQSYLRDRSRESHEELIEEQIASPAESDLLETAEREAHVRRALDHLDRTDREILLRTLTKGEKPGAIAEALGLSSEVVRQRKSRAIRKVADFVTKLSQSCHKASPPHTLMMRGRHELQ
jgi:RNA polymerase sigma-70 factor, ECF subfamily